MSLKINVRLPARDVKQKQALYKGLSTLVPFNGRQLPLNSLMGNNS